MQLNFPTNPSIAGLDPLIISSPTIRSGTTLLQRLLCSSRQALIYGELCGQDLDFFLNLYAFKVQEYKYYQQRYAANMDQVLQGGFDDWIPDLMPDIDHYLAAISQAAFSGLSYCRDFALQAGRPYWGFKYPGWKPAMVSLLRQVMPPSRFIFIYRDVIDCLRSAKAQHAIHSPQDVYEFCFSWSNNLDYILSQASDPAVLVVRYEELLSAPMIELERIAQFSGVSDMNPLILNRKINAWTGDDYLAQAKDGYTPPVELSETEMKIVRETTSTLRDRLYSGESARPLGVSLTLPENLSQGA